MYEGAVYLHQGHNYLVKELNIPDKIAFCEKANLKYYTKTRDYTDIHVVGGNIVCQLLTVRPLFPLPLCKWHLLIVYLLHCHLAFHLTDIYLLVSFDLDIINQAQ